jgi:hypothetical protein
MSSHCNGSNIGEAQNALSSSRENVMTLDDCRFCCTNAGPMPQGESRRVFLLGAAAAAGGLLATPRRAAAAEPGEAVPLFAYIGCFTTERRKAHSKGISVYRIDANGSWSLVQTLETLPNPQFIAFDQRQKFLYSVHGDGTEVSSYAIDKASGRISFLNKQPTSGNNSTHLTPDPTTSISSSAMASGSRCFRSIRMGRLLRIATWCRREATWVPIAIRSGLARTRILSDSIQAGAFFLHQIAAPTGRSSIGWTLRAASFCRTIPHSPGAAPALGRAT